MLNCQKASQLLSQSLDRPLSFRERLSLRLHLLMCDACRRFAKQLRSLRPMAAELESRVLTDDRFKLDERARKRIKRVLHDGGEQGPVS
ncbi:MAG TPA: zf-HC2 domain-containing protein [Methylococcaceae bacterium]|nr:zf-HC2 domain-containing protein [Methylococcaceae bacterium]